MLTAVFLSLLMTLCVCRDDNSVKRQTIYYEEEQKINIAPGVTEVNVDIDAAEPLSHVEEYFVSFTFGGSEFTRHVEKFNFSSSKLQTLMHALSPAILRVGGGGADRQFFDKPLSVLQAAGLRPTVTVITKQDIVNLVKLTVTTGNRLLFDVNLQLRFGNQWDPSNAIDLFEFFSSQDFCDIVDWELGNEPSVYSHFTGQTELSAEQLANDYVIFRKVLESYPCFRSSRVVGPDIFPRASRPESLKMIQAYYFRGDVASYQDYLNPAYFQNLVDSINLVQMSIAGSKYPQLPVWIGETSDAWHSGTANVSDRFVSGFLWLDKLGLSAQKGLGVVMRETLCGGHYSLLDINMNPNPDYWLSLIHRQLVGTTVLGVKLTNAPNTTRVYAHCTRTGGQYTNGALTVFALNISPTDTTHLVFNNTILHQQPIDVYMLSPYNGVLSKYVLLNGQQLLMMISDTELPSFKPVRLEPWSKVTLSPLTFGFFVFPEAGVKICDV